MSKGDIFVISLGCDKNRVDTENLLFLLGKGGYGFVDNAADADIILINTCAFIKSAEKESIDTIFDAAKLKEGGRLKKLIVTGCLPMRYKEKLAELLPEVDIFVGLDDYSRICELLENGTRMSLCGDGSASGKRILSTPPHFAYLKIAEGCDNFCTYCTIPSIRGKYRSREIESLVTEAKFLDDCGVGELIIVAQDVTKYGFDLYGEYKLTTLLRRLLSDCSFQRLRLLYCYPELVFDDLIDLVAEEPRIAKYMDVPLQHVSDAVLKRMGRRSNKAQIERLFAKLRDCGIAVRTTFMVGFPGETEEDFSELVEFVREYKPVHIGVFAYSKEEGTPSSRMKEQVSKSVKLSRVNRLGELAERQAKERNSLFVGQTVDVIYENIDYERNMFVGRTEWDAPEIDGTVYFRGDFVEVGNVYRVRITDFDGYDLIGEKV